ncbi:MAG: TRAP transporter substrate-binding protein [Marvinbryantia sp.]|uniref:TRAP transporter substrate-binding protein n=1 Tax=Marvinbryantia sp. TaxID=2496532 RepID=UPI003999FDF3
MGTVLWQIGRTGETVPEYVLNYAENQTADYPTTLGAYRFAELVERQTNGRIKVIVQPEAELGAEKEVLRQMKYGGIDFARISLSQLAELIPEMNALQMPYLYRDSTHMWEVLSGEIGDYFLEKAGEVGLVGLSWYDAGVRNFYTSQKQITCLEDLQGMTIRVQESDMMADMVEALGATAVQIAYSEVYSSIQLGEVDGAENNWPSYKAMNHDEVAKYYTVDEHTRVPEMQLVSAHTWEKLSEEDQEIILECAKESARLERRLWKLQEKQSQEKAVKNGTVVIEISDEEKERFRAAVEPVYQKYCGEYMDIIERIREL